MDDLVQKAAAIQDQHGWTNKQMARILGVHRTTWSMTRRGMIPLGASVLIGFLTFAELQDEAQRQIEQRRELIPVA